jgi:electron transfer flavoprotein beta subunit
VKICVLVKAVPDALRRVLPETGRLDRSGEGGLNTADRYAIEAALRLREAGGLGELEVVAVTMGPQSADRALRRALAMGCDQAVHLCDEALAGSDLIATGSALAQLLRRQEPGMVLLGESSADGATGALAAIVAEFLGLPVLAGARALKAGGSGLVAEQITEFGRLTVAVEGGAVLSIATDANTPRYASLSETMEARSRPVQLLSCADLGLDPEFVGAAGSAVHCGSWHQPVPRTAGTVIEPESVEQAVGAIVGWLEAEGLV